MSTPEAPPPPDKEVPKVSFGDSEEAEQSAEERELQQENAETSLDQPSQ